MRQKQANKISPAPEAARALHAAKMRGYLPHYISRLMNVLNLRLLHNLRPHGITIRQFRIMQMLDARERATMGDELALRRSALEACLGRLDDRQRELIDQRYGSEQTIRQLAERTGRPVKTLYKTLERVRASLMVCIKQRLAEAEA